MKVIYWALIFIFKFNCTEYFNPFFINLVVRSSPLKLQLLTISQSSRVVGLVSNRKASMDCLERQHTWIRCLSKKSIDAFRFATRLSTYPARLGNGQLTRLRAPQIARQNINFQINIIKSKFLLSCLLVQRLAKHHYSYKTCNNSSLACWCVGWQ